VRLIRITALALAILAVSATAAMAQPFHDTGKYSGKTDHLVFSHGEYRAGKISFKATQHRITNIRFEIRVECSNGQHFSGVAKHGGFLTIDEDGKYSGSATTNGGTGKDSIKGAIRDDRASGSVRRTIKLDTSGNESASGNTCTSGRVEFKAHHVDEGR
jgi:heat shock protein HslJ